MLLVPTDNHACAEEQRLTCIEQEKALNRTKLLEITIAMLYRISHNTVYGTLRIMNYPIQEKDWISPEALIPNLFYTENAHYPHSLALTPALSNSLF